MSCTQLLVIQLVGLVGIIDIGQLVSCFDGRNSDESSKKFMQEPVALAFQKVDAGIFSLYKLVEICERQEDIAVEYQVELAQWITEEFLQALEES